MRNFTSVIGAAVTQLNEPPCLLWVGSWSIPFRTIMNTKQCETRELSGHSTEWEMYKTFRVFLFPKM